MKPRASETVLVRSLHKDFAPVGSQLYLTPEEAKLMISIGRATLHVEPDKKSDTYKHREMVIRKK
jgi:hypothetical protein